jgi:hypothetical protein
MIRGSAEFEVFISVPVVRFVSWRVTPVCKWMSSAEGICNLRHQGRNGDCIVVCSRYVGMLAWAAELWVRGREVDDE